MNPEQTPTPTPSPSQAPIDYLNQITPKPSKNQWIDFGSKKSKIIFGLAGLIILVLIIAVIAVALQPDKKPIEQLAAKLQATLTISKNAQTTLKSSALLATNSNLELYLTNINRDMVKPLANNGIVLSKINKTIIASEAGTDITARLADAQLNANYDQVYANEMAYQLSTILTMIHQINASTNSQSLKDLFKNADSDLDPLQTQFANYNSTQDN